MNALQDKFNFTKFDLSQSLSRRTKLNLLYGLFLVPLYLASFTLEMDDKGWYVNFIILLNLIGIAAFYMQFPLTGRLNHLPFFRNIDWGVSKHKTIGYWIAGIFFLHPFLIIAPKFLLSPHDGIRALVNAITAPEMLTGVIGWVLFVLWVLMSIFKNKLPMRYQVWRLTHSIGFAVIAILVTFHVTSVGSHGQFEDLFNVVFWVVCVLAVAGVVYNFVFKPNVLSNTAFTVQQVQKVSSSDWMLTLRANESSDEPFSFEAGQFVWINTHQSAYNVDTHPFSIASCQADLPNISFIIRELGDYTQSLGKLKTGQSVYLEGPFGQMTLQESNKAEAITLIAGGAGLAPMLGLVRQLHANNDPREIRLIYGNRRWDQMALLDEIKALQQEMTNFKAILVCDDLENIGNQYPEQNKQQGDSDFKVGPFTEFDVRLGIIDKEVLASVVQPDSKNVYKKWAVYTCGPAAMMHSVSNNLKAMGLSNNQIHFESFVF